MGLHLKYKLLLLTRSDARGRLEVHKNIIFTTQRAFCPEKKNTLLEACFKGIAQIKGKRKTLKERKQEEARRRRSGVGGWNPVECVSAGVGVECVSAGGCQTLTDVCVSSGGVFSQK